jgi:EAL domain-containing protein (putative c-di-GMP-specific phosphodiesterase class I)/GGDEF domain-containing protein
VGAFSELTRKHLRQTRWQLEHDPVTALPNHYRLARDFEAEDTNNASLRLYLIFIANLPELELRLGGGVRESMIRTTVDRLQSTLSHRFGYYHVRSNHIALLVRDCDDDAGAILNELRQAAQEPIMYQGIPLIPDCVYGCTDIDGQAEGAMEYLRRTEVCVIQARSRRIDFLPYSVGLEEMTRHNVELLGLLKAALDNDALHLNYQPKYDLKSRRVTGMEALLRWHDENRGAISPASFISIAENSQLVRPLTYWVITRALRDLQRLRDGGIALDSVAVNISAGNLLDSGFIGDMERILKDSGTDAGLIELEVTETSIMRDVDFCREQIRLLREMGIHVSLDDFGTGYSSLQYLDQIPFSCVKLDQSFIRELTQFESKRHIVHATVNLVHQLGSTTVAEGIEDAETEALLRDMQCDAGQGYYFSRPLDFGRIQDFLQAGIERSPRR